MNSKSTWQKLFSPQGWVVIALVIAGYWLFFDNQHDEKKTSTLSDQMPIGIGNALNSATVEKLGADLTEHLDPKLIPGLIEQAIKDAAQSGANEAAFVQALVASLSQKIQGISTIDLNKDGVADPILVVPQPMPEGEEVWQLSIRVPEPEVLETLPDSSDAGAWREIAESKSLELMTASATKAQGEQMQVQTAPNPQMYAGAAPYYHHGFGLGSALLTGLMLSWMFSSRFSGGWGGYGYQPRPVASIQQSRSAMTGNLNPAQGSSTPAQSASGKALSSNNFKPIPPKTLNDLKSTPFRSNPSKAGVGTPEAGRNAPSGNSGVSKPASPSAPAYQSPQKRSFGGGGASPRRSFGGGFGKRR